MRDQLQIQFDVKFSFRAVLVFEEWAHFSQLSTKQCFTYNSGHKLTLESFPLFLKLRMRFSDMISFPMNQHFFFRTLELSETCSNSLALCFEVLLLKFVLYSRLSLWLAGFYTSFLLSNQIYSHPTNLSCDWFVINSVSARSQSPFALKEVVGERGGDSFVPSHSHFSYINFTLLATIQNQKK